MRGSVVHPRCEGREGWRGSPGTERAGQGERDAGGAGSPAVPGAACGPRAGTRSGEEREEGAGLEQV